MTILAFLTQAGSILAAGTLALQDAIALANLIKSVVDANGNPTDAQWEALHAYEARMTAALDSRMEGEE